MTRKGVPLVAAKLGGLGSSIDVYTVFRYIVTNSIFYKRTQENIIGHSPYAIFEGCVKAC